MQFGRPIPNYCLAGLSAILAAAVLPGSTVWAQRSRAGDRAMSDAARARDAELNNRELVLRHLGDPPKRSEQELKLALVQIKEDFERMQAVNIELMKSASTSQALDFKQVYEATGEINHRARRLKTNLAMPDPEEEAHTTNPSTIDGERLKSSLTALDDLIMSFVTNPFFRNPKVIDRRQAAKARQDLQGIIDLSHGIRKSADKLRATSAGNR